MTNKPEKKLIYRIIAQTDKLTITGQMKNETTEAEAVSEVHKTFLHEDVVKAGGYRNFVALPICTEEEWRTGNVNFCPRCGHRLEDIEDNSYCGECFECGAEIDVHIET